MCTCTAYMGLQSKTGIITPYGIMTVVCMGMGIGPRTDVEKLDLHMDISGTLSLPRISCDCHASWDC